MQVGTMSDVAVLVRSTRLARGMTQAELAAQLRVSRDWVVRLEKGHPRLEAQRVLDALHVLGVEMWSANPAVERGGTSNATRPGSPGKRGDHSVAQESKHGPRQGVPGDPFDDVFRTDGGR